MKIIKASVAVAIGVMLGSAVSHGQHYPAKPVRVIVATAAGGPTDLNARIVTEALGAKLGQQFFIDNRGGASGALAVSAVTKSDPDGYTLLVSHSSPIVVHQSIMTIKPSYDVKRDLIPISQLSEGYAIMAVHPSISANTLKEFVAYAKRRPGELNYSSTPVGNAPYLAAEQFKILAGIDLVNIPYKSQPESIAATIGGHTSFTFATLENIELIKSGQLKPLAIAGRKRLPDLPDVPTVAEAGYPDFAMGAWYAMFAPAGTSPEVVSLLSNSVQNVLHAPLTAKKMRTVGFEVIGGTSEELSAHMDREIERWRTVIDKIGIKM